MKDRREISLDGFYNICTKDLLIGRLAKTWQQDLWIAFLGDICAQDS